jgi:phenylacetate-CoA ligase
MALITPEEESLILAALRRAYERSPFWRARLGAAGISQRDFVPGFAFQSLPLLTKHDLLKDQAAHPPFGTLLAVDPGHIRRIHKTSGTTATPLFIALTERDVTDTYMASNRAFKAAGMGPQDRVVHCLNFNMWSGGVTDYMPIEATGATGIPFGVGNTPMLLRTIKALGINAISSTPSYMFTLRDRCREELGIDPKDLGLRRGYFGGEGLLQVKGVRAEIEQTFGLHAVDANYGMSEVLSIIGGEGPDRDGLINHTHAVLYTELVGHTGKSVPIETGARGELVFSSLRREGQPLFRYRSNDMAEILHAEPGEDGLLRMRFRIIGRSDEMLVMKGVNFFPQSLLSVVPEFAPHVEPFYAVVHPGDGKIEKLTVVFETSVTPGVERDQLANAIQHRIAQLFQVGTTIAWRKPGTLPREGNKARYLIRDIPADAST